MKNIDCAHCAAKIEEKIRELPEVDDAVLTFTTRQLRVYSHAGAALLPQLQEIADKIEPGTVIEVRAKAVKKDCVVYNLENIDCAHCAAKIEEKIRELPDVDDAILTFTTRQLRVHSRKGTQLLAQLQEIADKIEPGTKITVREDGAKNQAKADNEEHKHDTAEIIAGAVLFVIGNILADKIPMASIACFVLAYIVLGKDILLAAFKNLKTGHMMDENFLMGLATIGAFAIQEYAEAVGVMLFYRIGEAFEHRAVEKSRSQIMDAVDI